MWWLLSLLHFKRKIPKGQLLFICYGFTIFGHNKNADDELDCLFSFYNLGHTSENASGLALSPNHYVFIMVIKLDAMSKSQFPDKHAIINETSHW